MTQQAVETLIGGADPALTARWDRFIREQDARYARLARATGAPYTPFDDAERCEVAAFAAALAVAPANAALWQATVTPDDVREFMAVR